MPITIPKRLQKKLYSDSTYEGYIHTLLNNTAALITEKADFFPEYTLHGWTHIQAVLNHADKLIPDVTMEVLTGRDAAILIAAVVLHDLGMFLNRAGVRKLLTGPRRTTKTARLDKLDWKAEWDRYIREIRRYPEEKLLYHFGMSHAIEEPDLEKGEFSDLDLLIVGDFLRRHHHRIAHEIALGTMPGDTDVDVMQVSIDALGKTAFDLKDRKCIGILARSHGMPIRATKDYIDWALGRQYQEKLTYLMTVLRIADALDAGERRAPDTVRRLQGIRTPVSVKEWAWNQRIVRTELDWNEGADYKYVECEPESTTEFVHLEGWLNWVQRELDTCWAVLSEVCDTQKYRLSIHRIESNILEEERRESYSEKFITKEARLNANPELLKLLVGPLYDDDPSCGVRELLQNAVDACNERAHLEGDSYRGQVEIRLDTKAKTLTVSDNGIGMDENVLLNYYLSAGASYRTSDQWFEQFATDRDPNIIRTGRFGVGVLATFLLGDWVEITTRYIKEERGYSFEFGLEPQALDIKRPEKALEIGTKITVHLKEEALGKLQKELSWWNWYRFAEPSVLYWEDERELEWASWSSIIPQNGQEVKDWFELNGTEYEMVRWGYPDNGFFCNGIRIPIVEEVDEYKDILHFPNPSISVIDKKGRLPVDLSRKKLLDSVLISNVRYELLRYTMAEILLADWSSPQKASQRFVFGMGKILTKRRDEFEDIYIPVPYICSKKGYAVFISAFVEKMNVDAILGVFLSTNSDTTAISSILKKMEPTKPISVYPLGIPTWMDDSNLLWPIRDSRWNAGLCGEKRMQIGRFWVSEEWAEQVREYDRENEDSNMERYARSMLKNGYAEYAKLPWAILDDEISKNQYLQRIREDRPFIWEYWNKETIAAISYGEMCKGLFTLNIFETEKNNAITDFIDIYMNGDPWIPYDMEERRKKFPKAFEELKYYIDRILADREKERGAQNA